MVWGTFKETSLVAVWRKNWSGILKRQNSGKEGANGKSIWEVKLAGVVKQFKKRQGSWVKGKAA